MSAVQIQISESLEAMPATARELWRRLEPGLQFDQTLGWNELLANHALEAGEGVQVLSAHRGAECIGVLPLKSGVREGMFGLKPLRALANYYCSLYSPILASGDRAEVLRQLLEAVPRLGPDVLDLNPLLDVADASAGEGAQADAAVNVDARSVASALEQLGWRAERYFRFGNWYLEVGGRSFAEYFAGLPSQLRNTVTRKEKKLKQQAGLSIDIAQTPAEAQAALAGYQQIYAASWKKPEPHPHFVPGLVRFLAERGWLRLGLVQLGAEPIAAQIWACKDGIVSIFKLAYDERFAQLSAGSVLTTQLMRHVIDVDRARIVDYLTGDDAYKRDWMSHRRERVGIRALSHKSWRARGESFAAAVASGLRPLRTALTAMRHRAQARRRPPTTPTA